VSEKSERPSEEPACKKTKKENINTKTKEVSTSFIKKEEVEFFLFLPLSLSLSSVFHFFSIRLERKTRN